jgi:hypothetical protein
MRLDKILRYGLWTTAAIFAAYPALSGGRLMLTVSGLGQLTWLLCIILMLWSFFGSPKCNHSIGYDTAIAVFLNMLALLVFVWLTFPLPAWCVAAIFGTIAYNLNPSRRHRKTKRNPSQIAHSQSYTIIDHVDNRVTKLNNNNSSNHSSISDYF